MSTLRCSLDGSSPVTMCYRSSTATARQLTEKSKTAGGRVDGGHEEAKYGRGTPLHTEVKVSTPAPENSFEFSRKNAGFYAFFIAKNYLWPETGAADVKPTGAFKI